MKILSIIGARPQFVKAAVFRSYCQQNSINEILLHTGQHYDPEMSVGIFDELGVKQPDIIQKLSARTHGGMTAELIRNIEEQIISIKPDFVNVYGDTNSTLAGALTAAKLHTKVSHVEAGLRSFNKKMPEELNRILTDHVSDYLFCPTKTAVTNLAMENISKNVFHVGDIMQDAVQMFSKNFRVPKHVIKNPRDLPIAIMTVHRAESLSDRNLLQKLVLYCRSFCLNYHVIFPCHPNTRRRLAEFETDTGMIEVIEPLPYLEMQGLISESSLVLTDSGGLQKEAYFHRRDCITLRDETEWKETIDFGWNRLWNSDTTISEKRVITEYGSGNTAGEIIKILSSR